MRVAVNHEGRGIIFHFFFGIGRGPRWIVAVIGGNPERIGDSKMVDGDMTKPVFCFLWLG